MELSEIARRGLEARFGTIPSLPLRLEDRAGVKLAMARAAFGIDFADMEVYHDFLDEGDREIKANVVNAAQCEVLGFGREKFTVHELSHPDIEPSEATTILDLDRAGHRFVAPAVAKARGEPIPEYTESLYAFITMRRGAEKITYALLYAAEPYLWHVLEERLYDWVERRWPTPAVSYETREEAIEALHRSLHNPTDMESLRHDLLREGSALIPQVIAESNGIFGEDDAWVHVVSEDLGHEIKETVVFSNRRAMERVRIGSFTDDVSTLPIGTDRLEEGVALVSAQFDQRLEDVASDVESRHRENRSRHSA
jgi:hypothetical protein